MRGNGAKPDEVSGFGGARWASAAAADAASVAAVSPVGAFPEPQRASASVGQVLERISRGTRLEEILDFIYERFRAEIPFDRISLATVDGQESRLVARWARSDGSPQIGAGYSMDLNSTSLAEVFRSGRPRIIHDLETYLDEHPHSEGTRLLVAEGLRSSLTCPLIVDGRPTGFLFFNSKLRGAYSDSHISAFAHLAATVAMLFELGHLFDELTEQKAVVERQRRLLADENGRHNRELALARGVQRALIHGELPRDSRLRAEMLYEPAALIGGDLVECIGLDRNTGLICVADALGHGVPAALVMSVVRTALHSALADRPDGTTHSPAALLGAVNRTLTDLFDQQYVTAVIALVDANARTVTMSLAGHPPALVRRRAPGRVEATPAHHVPLGIAATTRFADIQGPFLPGDVLVLYTDGVIEAEDSRETPFGQMGLRAALEGWSDAAGGRLTDHVRAAVADHARGAPLLDDLAILAVDYRESTPGRRHW